MKKVLLAIDETVGSKAVLSVFQRMDRKPETAVLVYLDQYKSKSGRSGILNGFKLKALARSSHPGTPEAQDRKTERVTSFYKKELENMAPVTVTVLPGSGNPSEDILRAAREQGVDVIIMGCNNKPRLQRLADGRVIKEVERRATVPVLVA